MDWRWAWWERAGFGLLGVGGVVGSLWVSVIWAAVGMLSTACWAAVGWAELGAGILFGAVTGSVVAACWALSVSSLRVAAGRRGLQRRSWLALAAMAGVIAAVYLSYAAAVAPEVAALDCGLQLH